MKKKILIGSVVIFSVILGIVSVNLSKIKLALSQTKMAGIYAHYIRDGRSIDENHLITTLDNGMQIIVNKHDRCVCWSIRLVGRWDSNETAVIKYLVKPGFSIIEVGANFGVHTLRMAELVGNKGKIYAFEANPYVSKYLKQSVELNVLNDIVTVYEKAAGNKNEIGYLIYGTQNIGGGHLVSNNTDNAIKTEIVRLDDILADKKIDILKIDAEGYEEKIIQGGKKIIEANPYIIIMMEWSQDMLRSHGIKPSAFLEMLKNDGFKVWKIGDRKEDKPNLIKVSFEEVLEIPYCDLVLSREDKI